MVMRTIALGVLAAVAIGTSVGFVKHLADPLNASCERILSDPYHEARAAADRVNEFLNDGGGDSYFAMMALCGSEPGVSVAQVAEDLRAQSHGAPPESLLLSRDSAASR